MKLSSEFITLIEDADIDEGDVLLGLLDEPDILVGEIMHAALIFLESRIDNDMSLSEALAYADKHVLHDDDEDPTEDIVEPSDDDVDDVEVTLDEDDEDDE